MPDLANRGRHESSIAGTAYLLFVRNRPVVASAGFSKELFSEEWRQTLAPKLERVHRDAFNQLARKFGVDYDPAELSSRFADRYAKKLGKEIAADLAEKISSHTDPDVERSHYLADLAKEQLNRARARRIAITETTRAISMAEHDAVMKISRLKGIVLKPRWYTSELANVCQICQPLHGKPAVVWRRRFPFGPPAHPSCNCWIEYDEED